MFHYNVIFLKNENDILMVNRERKPMLGLWNGMINQHKKDEHPDEAARRKVFEETNYSVEKFDLKGTFTWENEDKTINGINIYVFTIEQVLMKNKLAKTKNGILEWKNIDWILDEQNEGVHSILKQGLPQILNRKGLITLGYEDGSVKQVPQTLHR